MKTRRPRMITVHGLNGIVSTLQISRIVAIECGKTEQDQEPSYSILYWIGELQQLEISSQEYERIWQKLSAHAIIAF